MCSRYSLTSPPDAVRSLFDLRHLDTFPPRPSIAPTEPVLIIRNDVKAQREAVLMRWALIPAWVKDPKSFAVVINARSETVAEKPSFRAAFRHRRCLVPADAFYEWSGPPRARQPNLISLKSRSLFAFAGLFETWLGADGSEIDTVAILTTAANADMEPVHDRMPVILAPDDYDLWLDCRPGTGDAVKPLLQPLADGLIDINQVEKPARRSKTSEPAADTPELPFAPTQR